MSSWWHPSSQETHTEVCPLGHCFQIQHGDHFDFLVGDHLHHVHDYMDDEAHSLLGDVSADGAAGLHHCDDHGTVTILDDDALTFYDSLAGIGAAPAAAAAARASQPAGRS